MSFSRKVLLAGVLLACSSLAIGVIGFWSGNQKIGEVGASIALLGILIGCLPLIIGRSSQ